MSENQFFERKGPFPLNEIIKAIGCNGDFSKDNNFKIYSLESLDKANSNDLTFLNSSKYLNLSSKTKASACITSPNLSKFLPDKCIKLDVKNVLFAVTQVAKMFYPNADMDLPDENLSLSVDVKNLYPDVKFGKNVFIGKNVKIGKKSNIASNCVIESNVVIGENCIIGPFSVVKNSIISNVSATETRESTEIKDLLIKQIESPVRWRESVIYMLKNGVTKFIEIGPGKVLSGLIKRIERNVDLISVNGLEDLKDINLND